tara:strand:+ start:1148 stop:1288 length:141 start_codon:yes stop_codon:yes gene_type:complete
MSIQLNNTYEKILKKIAAKKKLSPLEVLLPLLLKEHKEVFKQEYQL